MNPRVKAYDMLDKAGANRLWIVNSIDLGQLEGWSINGHAVVLHFHREDAGFSHYLPSADASWLTFGADLAKLNRR